MGTTMEYELITYKTKLIFCFLLITFPEFLLHEKLQALSKVALLFRKREFRRESNQTWELRRGKFPIVIGNQLRKRIISLDDKFLSLIS